MIDESKHTQIAVLWNVRTNPKLAPHLKRCQFCFKLDSLMAHEAVMKKLQRLRGTNVWQAKEV